MGFRQDQLVALAKKLRENRFVNFAMPNSLVTFDRFWSSAGTPVNQRALFPQFVESLGGRSPTQRLFPGGARDVWARNTGPHRKVQGVVLAKPLELRGATWSDSKLKELGARAARNLDCDTPLHEVFKPARR